MYKNIVEEMKTMKFSGAVDDDNICFKEIIQLFDQYFENKGNLKKYSCDYLVQDYLNYQKNYYDDIDAHLLEITNFFRRAKVVSNDLTYEGFARFQTNMVEMGNKYWSMCKMQRDFDELDFYEYVTECFRLIEDVCEILIKNYFSLMLYIKRLLNSNIPDLGQIQMMKFGQMYNELKQSSLLRNILGILKSEVSISQWRNIACHKSYECIGEKILCKYGENLEKTVMVNSKEDLLNITLSIYRISQLFTISSKFFLYDNIHEIREKMDELSIDICNTRDEDWQLIFVTELYANGFELLKIKDEEGMIVTVRDMTEEDVEARLIGVPIMAYKCWVLTGRDPIKIIYLDSKGIPCYSIQLSADVCEKVSNYQEDWIYLADNMTIENLQ